METKLSIKLSELDINIEPMLGLMGYTDEDIPPLIIETIEKELAVAQDKVVIEGGYIIKDAILDAKDYTIQIGSEVFNPSQAIWELFDKAEKIAVFACTAGEYISNRSSQLMNEGLVLEGYIVDVIGSVIVERGMDKIHKSIKDKVAANDMIVSNRYSPGYWKWDVAEQHKVFSLLPEGFCGISLSDSALMYPIKSVSGLIAIGHNVIFKKYNCSLCNQENCQFRKRGNKKGCAYSNSI